MEIKKQIEYTNQFVKILVYGQAGAGKTYLIKELAQHALLISAEGGLLSLAGTEIDHITIDNLDGLKEVYAYLNTDEAKKRYKIVALDSISEVAEKVLSAEKENAADQRKAYMEMQDAMTIYIRGFRDLPYHVYFSAKAERASDEFGAITWAPSMPGTKLGQQLPYFFDEVLALRVGKNEKGETVRWLQTQPDGIYTAKDRSGRLDPSEPASLKHVIGKILKREDQKNGKA